MELSERPGVSAEHERDEGSGKSSADEVASTEVLKLLKLQSWMNGGRGTKVVSPRRSNSVWYCRAQYSIRNGQAATGDHWIATDGRSHFRRWTDCACIPSNTRSPGDLANLNGEGRVLFIIRIQHIAESNLYSGMSCHDRFHLHPSISTPKLHLSFGRGKVVGRKGKWWSIARVLEGPLSAYASCSSRAFL